MQSATCMDIMTTNTDMRNSAFRKLSRYPMATYFCPLSIYQSVLSISSQACNNANKRAHHLSTTCARERMWLLRGTSFIIYICFNCLGANCHSTCSKDFVDVGDNTHMIAFVGKVNYCDAHRTCEDEGKRCGLRLFVPGLNIRRARPEFNQYTILPTSVTALLNYSSTDLYAGWRVGDPGYASYVTNGKDSFTSWPKAHMSSINKRHAVFVGPYLMATSLYIMYHATVCEKSENSVNNTMERFDKNWPLPGSEVLPPDLAIEICFKRFISSTLLHCGMRCKLRYSCRAFYFNSEERHCALALYVDSLLPNSSKQMPGTWVRFGRPNW